MQSNQANRMMLKLISDFNAGVFIQLKSNFWLVDFDAAKCNLLGKS